MGLNKINPSAALAELIGTFILSFGVLASVNGLLDFGGVDSAGIPTQLVAGGLLGFLAMAIGGISGAHVNPAITLGALAIKKIDLGNALVYMIMQVVGAIVALFLMNGLVDGDVLGAVASDENTVLAGEFIGTMVFAFGVAAAVFNKATGAHAGLLVGSALAIGATFASTASNGILNPAVALALDSVNLWYVIGPILGSVVGMYVYQMLMNNMTATKKR